MRRSRFWQDRSPADGTADPRERRLVDQVESADDEGSAGPREERPAVRPGVDYKGAPLDADRGPGLGCFWLQVIVLAIVVVLTPLSAAWEWPVIVTIVLMATTLVLLLFVGQTVIFLLRLVAADRRATGRRRPMRSGTKTVGEIEDDSTEDQSIEDESTDRESTEDRTGPG
jgi:hypothetical protein